MRARDFIPQLIATFTGPRYAVRPGENFEWSKKSITHNAFRVFEMVCGRNADIAPEVTAYEYNGKSYEFAHTWEASFAIFETRVRQAFSWKLAPFKIYVHAFASPGMFPVFPQRAYLFAIATDATATGSYGASPRTWTHTCTGSDLAIFESSFSFGSGSTASYNSVALTNLGGYQYNGTPRYGKLNYLLNPATGANTMSITPSGDGIGVSVSYSGVKQTGQPDAAINTQTSNSASSLTATVTVTASGSWLMMGTICEGAALTAGSGATLRKEGSNVAVSFFDSNGAPGTGSQSMTVNESPANGLACGMVSIAPAAAAAKTYLGFFAMHAKA